MLKVINRNAGEVKTLKEEDGSAFFTVAKREPQP